MSSIDQPAPSTSPIRPAGATDVAWIGDFLRKRWGATTVAVHGEVIRRRATTDSAPCAATSGPLFVRIGSDI